MSSHWLFRQGELILGPLEREELAQRILSGELGEETEVRELEGASFRALKDIEAFAIALAKAKAKQRVEVLSEKRALAKRRRLLKTLGAVFCLLLLGSAAAFFIGQELAGRREMVSTESLAFAGLSTELPSISRSPKGGKGAAGSTLLSYQEGRQSGGGRRPAGAEGGGGGGRGPAAAWTNEVQTDIQWNPDNIKQVLNSNERRLLSCLQGNVKASDGWNRGELITIPIEFTISNHGRVNTLRVFHPRYKGGALEACLLQEMGKWPFAPYEGDQAVVTWPVSWKVRS